MELIVRGRCCDTCVTISCSFWGIDETGWLILRDESGKVSNILKTWDSIEVKKDDLILSPDDVQDKLERKKGYCDI